MESTDISSQDSCISDFLRDRCVLITGATGFLGKALVEKILRSCPEVEKIYMLVRPKHGQDVSSRFREYQKNPIFDRVRAECPNSISKLHVVSGEATRPNVGLSDEDRETLAKNVSVVFHTAATVKFNEPLKLAVLVNTQGTRRVVELCHSLPKLKAFIHVSTAYSNADKRDVREEVYSPPSDPDLMINLVSSSSDDVINSIESRLIGKHPNTYTFTKAMAESIVFKESENIPTAIVRPSIVTAAWQEPAPGWVDNVSGITGICMEVGRGTVRSVFCDKSLTVDIVPVDIVVNTMLAAAANLHSNRPNHIPVYNCTSGPCNPLKWDKLRQYVLKSARASPSKYVQWYPECTFRVNRFMHRMTQIILQFLPAFILDIILRFTGIKPIMVRIYEKTRKSAKTGEFFATNEFNFEHKAMSSLVQSFNNNETAKFPIDLTKLTWEKYIDTYMMGIRQFVLKDDFNSMPAARRKLTKLYWGQKLVQGAALFFILKSVSGY